MDGVIDMSVVGHFSLISVKLYTWAGLLQELVSSGRPPLFFDHWINFSMNDPLTPEEARIIGCLMEKSVTTPDQYPLTLNALTNACNQKSSRQPVMNLQSGEVQKNCRQLKDRHLVRIEENFKKNTEKYSQRLCNTELGISQFNPAEYAIICLLLLRGQQTPGELKSRSGRLFSFESNQQVLESLNALMECEGGPVVARLARQAGRQDHEYIHLFAGDIDSVSEDAAITQRVPVSNSNQKISKLETRVAALEKAITDLAERLGEKIDLAQITDDLSPIDGGN